jgi:hypothetical protein
LAGLAKMAGMEAWANSLRDWSLIPAWSRGVLAMVIPLCEVATGVLGLLGFRSAAARAAALLLANFMVVLVAQRFVAAPPACGCFGVIDRYFESMRSYDASIVRVVVMLGLIGSALLLAPGRRL